MHTVQTELAGQRGLNRNQWITEGYAEWIAYAATQDLGLDEMSRQRARITAALRTAGGAGALPRLTQMDTFAQWIDTRRKYGYDATFSLAFLSVDFLMKRHSYRAVLDYLRQFRSSPDYPANFGLAFGESLDDFQEALERYLARLLD